MSGCVEFLNKKRLESLKNAAKCIGWTYMSAMFKSKFGKQNNYCKDNVMM